MFRQILVLSCALSACSAPSPSWSGVAAPPESVGGPAAESVRLHGRRLMSGSIDVHTIVWFGRGLAYLGRYEDAIAVYTEGLGLFPDEPHLLRHRGHRWITVRDFGAAVADLTRAEAQIDGQPDEIEPDGLPNARGIPTSTLRTNVLYHLGLAHRLRGDHAAAARAFAACVEAATSDDMEIAARYWLILCLWRLGRADDARAAAAMVREEADVIENHAYHRLCLLFSGRLGVEDVFAAETGEPSGTAAYGVACWHLQEGRGDAGRAWLERTVEAGAFASFGRIAAEVDLARLAAETR